MSKRSSLARSDRTTSTQDGVATLSTRRSALQAPVKPVRSRYMRRTSAARARKRFVLLSSGLLVLIAAGIAAAILATRSTTSTAGDLVSASAYNPSGQLLSTGTAAPGFTLSTIDGKRYSLSSLKGRPVLLEFFAVWCPYCQAESGILNQIDKNYGPKGLQTLAVLSSPYGRNYDTSGGTDLSVVSKSDVSWFIQNFGVKHPTLIDPNFSTVNTYGVSSYPTIYVLDKNGIIRYADSGEQSYSLLAGGIAGASR